MSTTATAAIAVYALRNLISLAAYGWDKHKAVKDKWRTPEKTLILLGLVGPWGAVIEMNLFHHKTRKTKFKANYVFLVLHVIVICLIAGGYVRIG